MLSPPTGILPRRASRNPARVSTPPSRGRLQCIWVSRSRRVTLASRIMPPAPVGRAAPVAKFLEEIENRLGLGHDEDFAHDLAQAHIAEGHPGEAGAGRGAEVH